jgi:phosphate starvation-inducible protein PhoH and related proteins
MKISPNNKIKLESLVKFEPMTDKQALVVKEYKKDACLVLSGSAGTGKTYIALSLALEDVLDKNNKYERIVIVRSIVPTRDIGFLPGDEDEKKDAYTAPYRSIITEICSGQATAWEKLTETGEVEFMSTSFIRGLTISNAIIIVDECQNCSGHELDSIITRVGRNCKIIFCGDYHQSDFTKETDKKGIIKFLEIIQQMNKFSHIEFTWKDIIRSGIVRDYIMTKEMLKITF